MTGKSFDNVEPGVLRVLQGKDETRKFYNKIARVYDLLAERSEQPVREIGLGLLAAAPGEHVLEIGFGTGHCLAALARAVGPNGKVSGIDLSDRMVEIATERMAGMGFQETTDLRCGDAAHLPFDENTMDGVFLSFTLELFDTPETPVVLNECLRVLGENARIVVVGVSKEGKPGMVLRAFEWTHRHFPNLMDCRPIYVRRALETVGFEIVSTSIEHMWVPVEIVLARKRSS